ncbi:GNAT family N-acetyltransferase [Brachybacterium sp. AOP43-C2-M15]|uniref:GNAT family N-acetyltransferase n=1 Tax=Brachybacterium sp. AOP43-C2-M15 TaxID=3457661 RepID=UPI0040343D91
MTSISLTVPSPDELAPVLAVLSAWQKDAGPLQLHPGDVGWHHLRGAERAAADLRLWRRGGRPVALGMLDGRDLLRTALDPALVEDREIARAMAADLLDPGRGALPDGRVFLEARGATALREELMARGWVVGDPWVPLQRDLGAPDDDLDLAAEEPALTVEEVTASSVAEYTAVHRAAFDSEGVTDERFRELAGSRAARESVSLLGRDGASAAAIITVWSAGAGRPGLIEPLGVHPAHRGRGHGRAMCLAAAARLRTMGSSSAVVCTPRSLTGAVATYVAAGFRRLPDVPDLARGAAG